MLNYPTKEHIKYYFSERDKVLQQKFYKAVLFQIFSQYFDLVMRKYDIFPGIQYYDDLKQDLQIHAYNNLSKIGNANDSNAFLITISKNVIINFLSINAKRQILPIESMEEFEGL